MGCACPRLDAGLDATVYALKGVDWLVQVSRLEDSGSMMSSSIVQRLCLNAPAADNVVGVIVARQRD